MMRSTSSPKRESDRDPLPPARRRGRTRLACVLAAPRDGGKPPRPRRAEAPPAAASVGAEDARPASGAPACDRGLVVRLPAAHARPPDPVAERGAAAFRRRSEDLRGLRSGHDRARVLPPALGQRRPPRADTSGAGGGARSHHPHGASHGREFVSRLVDLRSPRRARRAFRRFHPLVLGRSVRGRVGAAGAAARRDRRRDREAARIRGRLRPAGEPVAQAPRRSRTRGVRPRPSARSPGRRHGGAPAPARPQRLRLAARPGELRRAVAAQHRLPGAVPRPERTPTAALRRPRPAAARARRADAAAGAEADRGAPAVDAGAGAARGISEAGLSKHLRQLADAGLVEPRREGYYVLYSLVPERIEPLTDSLRRFLSE